MDTFDSVFVQFFYYQSNVIFCNDFVPFFRKTVQMFNDQTSKGVIIFRIQTGTKMVVYIVQTHGTFNDIFMVGDFFHQFILAFVVFIVNLTDNLFQNIFQSDETCHFTVFIYHNGNVKGGCSHFHKKFGDILVFVCEMRSTEIMTDIKRFITVIKEQILHIDDTNHIILILFVYRKSGKAILTEDVDQLLVSTFHTGKSHIDSGNHNIFGIGIAKIKDIIDHFFFVRLDHTVFVAYVYDGTEFFFCHSFAGCIRIYTKEMHHPSGKQIDDENKRCHEIHKELQHRNIPECDLFGIESCVILRCDLTENKNYNGQKCSGDTDHIPSEMICQSSCQRRCGNIYDVISDQDSTEHLGCTILYNIKNKSSTFVSLFSKRTEANLIDCHQCSFV